MKKLVIVLVLVASAGLNAKNLSGEEFYELVNDCVENENKDSCQRLIDSGQLASVEECDKNTCSIIAFIYGDVVKNYYKANAYYKTDCERFNSSLACYSVGQLYNEGKGVKQDFFTAKKYFEKACNLNLGDACNSLGFLYSKGKGVKQNYSAAKKYYGKSCDLGDQMGCDNYKILNEQGIQ